MKREDLLNKIVIADEYTASKYKAKSHIPAWPKSKWKGFKTEHLEIAWEEWAEKAYKKAMNNKNIKCN